MLNDILSAVAQAGQSLLLFTSRNYFPDCFNRFGLLQDGSFSVKEIPEAAGIQTEIPLALKRKDLPAAVHFDYPDFRYAVHGCERFTFNMGNKKILNHINWTVEKGECWSLTGPE